jgi:hypothetical protein
MTFLTVRGIRTGITIATISGGARFAKMFAMSAKLEEMWQKIGSSCKGMPTSSTRIERSSREIFKAARAEKRSLKTAAKSAMIARKSLTLRKSCNEARIGSMPSVEILETTIAAEI